MKMFFILGLEIREVELLNFLYLSVADFIRFIIFFF